MRMLSTQEAMCACPLTVLTGSPVRSHMLAYRHSEGFCQVVEAKTLSRQAGASLPVLPTL
jgi:hypothetical protein